MCTCISWCQTQDFKVHVFGFSMKRFFIRANVIHNCKVCVTLHKPSFRYENALTHFRSYYSVGATIGLYSHKFSNSVGLNFTSNRFQS